VRRRQGTDGKEVRMSGIAASLDKWNEHDKWTYVCVAYSSEFSFEIFIHSWTKQICHYTNMVPFQEGVPTTSELFADDSNMAFAHDKSRLCGVCSPYFMWTRLKTTNLLRETFRPCACLLDTTSLLFDTAKQAEDADLI
jgi:hypothetical protein